MERIIDLHVHTTCSDGAFSPKEIVDRAKQNNVSVLAIADHDSIEAYNDEFFAYAKEKGVEIIPAVEMSTRFMGVGVHVLGYNIDLTNEKLLETLSKLKNARQNYLIDVSKKLEDLGYEVNVEELKKAPSVTKAHISLDVVSNPNNNELLMKTFGHIPSKGEFIETIMNENCPAYVEKFSISSVEASEIIHLAGGKVSLAHPVAYKHEDGVDADWVANLVNQMKPDGLEANYLYVNRNEEEIDETAFWNEFATAHGLFPTVGSDFHAIDEIRPDIGFANKAFKLEQSQIDLILKNLKK